MAVDPRTFFVVPCEKGQRSQLPSTTARRNFFSDLGRIGDLEVLNDLGYGEVAEGLRILAKLSDSIRVGDVSASSLGDEATGTKTILDAIGISPSSLQQASVLNPNVANSALGQIKAIYEKIKQGEFELSDIPEVFSDLQNLSTLIGNIFTDPRTPEARAFEACGASPYATDLIRWAPKFKFLFVVQIEFTKPYADKFKDIHAAFVVKQSTRPNVNIEHEEVNMYNFWTKVPKRTVYEPMTLKFYDDNYNQAMTLYNGYLKAISPIANLAFDQEIESVRGMFQNASMDFDKLNTSAAYPGPASTHGYASSYGPTADPDTMNIFKRITLFHVYREGTLMNVYRFYNPKIITMELDDLDMADNAGGNEVTLQFAYDGLNILTGQPTSDTNTYDLRSISGGAYGATYPLKYIGESDVLATDPRQPPASEQNLLMSLQDVADNVTNTITDTFDSGRQLVSNAFNSASEYLGSDFL